MNDRRKFLMTLCVGVLAGPCVSVAQQPGKIWRIGFFSSLSRQALQESGRSDAFLQGMRELGFVEGKNLVIEWRSPEGKPERLPGLAAELVQLKVDVVVTAGMQPTSTLQKATTAIPIVMVNVSDPVAMGFVKTLAHPGGNLTGLANIASDFGPKHLEMLLEMVPNLFRVAVLVNPANSGNLLLLTNVQTAARGTKATIRPVEVRSATEIENAFSEMVRDNAGAVIVARDALFLSLERKIVALAVKNRLPSISGNPEFVKAGGLMGFGPSNADIYRRAATYVSKILKGAKPGDLPVEQPMRFEKFINGKTAKALGLTIPQSLWISADNVIE